jgi:hypothetical protein
MRKTKPDILICSQHGMLTPNRTVGHKLLPEPWPNLERFPALLDEFYFSLEKPAMSLTTERSTEKTPSLAGSADHFHPLPLERTEAAASPSTDKECHRSSESPVPRTDDESQISMKTDSDPRPELRECSELGTEELLQAGIWLARLRMREDHSLKRSQEGQVMIKVEVKPLEIALPDWDYQKSWEANYLRVVDHVRKTLATRAQFDLVEIPA